MGGSTIAASSARLAVRSVSHVVAEMYYGLTAAATQAIQILGDSHGIEV